MLTPDDIQYALENTRVVRAPQHRLATFGTSLLSYYLVTEDMDSVNRSRVREGQIHAERPQIMTPAYFAKLMLEGFGDKAQEYAEAISANAQEFTFLKYGFWFKKTEIRTYEVHESVEFVTEKVISEVERLNNPLAGVIHGVDDGWEICLVKFMIDVINESKRGNLGDFRDHGML
ncbi:hypothetical protein DB346_20200 [Verrucomicrobia bacterium LW23]|nr:hypothetical protein DB346_20200 [Verrucomicrobia bacterium LW23]